MMSICMAGLPWSHESLVCKVHWLGQSDGWYGNWDSSSCYKVRNMFSSFLRNFSYLNIEAYILYLEMTAQQLVRIWVKLNIYWLTKQEHSQKIEWSLKDVAYVELSMVMMLVMLWKVWSYFSATTYKFMLYFSLLSHFSYWDK